MYELHFYCIFKYNNIIVCIDTPQKEYHLIYSACTLNTECTAITGEGEMYPTEYMSY